MRVQALVAKATVERLYEGIVGGPLDKLRRALPGRLKSSVTPFSYAQRSSAFEMNSGGIA